MPPAKVTALLATRPKPFRDSYAGARHRAARVTLPKRCNVLPLCRGAVGDVGHERRVRPAEDCAKGPPSSSTALRLPPRLCQASSSTRMLCSRYGGRHAHHPVHTFGRLRHRTD